MQFYSFDDDFYLLNIGDEWSHGLGILYGQRGIYDLVVHM